MLFENLYKAEDEAFRRQLKTSLTAYLVLFGFALLCIIGNRQPVKTKIPELPDSVRLARVDQLCRELSVPEQFNFVDNSSLISSFSIEVNYHYKTDRSFEEISPFFLIRFNSNGWRRYSNDWLQFSNDKYLVTIENVDLGKYNYTIKCAEIQ